MFEEWYMVSKAITGSSVDIRERVSHGGLVATTTLNSDKIVKMFLLIYSVPGYNLAN